MKTKYQRNTRSFPKQGLQRLWMNLREAIKEQSVQAEIEDNKRQILKLGEHLLKDLGFDKEGRLLKAKRQ